MMLGKTGKYNFLLISASQKWFKTTKTGIDWTVQRFS